MQKVKVAVTGASGFIGRYLLSELTNYPVEITAISRDSSRLSGVDAHIKINQFDLEAQSADPYSELGSPDVLIHLAWENLNNYRSRQHFEDQLPLHYHFLREMVQGGVSSLFVAGTCVEYGLQQGALRETLSSQPILPYSYSKDALRKQLQFLQADIPFALTWGRLFYMYGEGQAANALYSQFQKAISNSEPSFNMSAGEQLRDYLHVSKVAQIIAQLAMRQENIGPINICSGEPISIRRLVEGWLTESGTEIQLNLGHYPYPDYEPMAYWGDRSYLDAHLELER